MVTLINSLKIALQDSHALSSKTTDGDIVELPNLILFSQQLEKLCTAPDKKDDPPPAERIKLAMSMLHNGLADRMTSRDWRCVFWSLNDKIANQKPVIEHEKHFSLVTERVASLRQEQRFRRADWNALCFSYFSYSPGSSEPNRNWLMLRMLIQEALHELINYQRRPKTWSEFAKNNNALFTADAGLHVGKAILSADRNWMQSLNQFYTIGQQSWLWTEVFSTLGQNLATLKDAAFEACIGSTLDLIKNYPDHNDHILAALLTRYHKSSNARIPNQLLKEQALLQWGSPQLKTAQNRWLLSVDHEVLAMVSRWFAKEDLEHFFKLLQGDHQVDQRRLDFWIEYVDAIAFTKVIMGSDALYNKSSDFQDYRKKNEGRFAALENASVSNNAFLMKIGSYWFVEFSETGNACHVFLDSDLPFKKEAGKFDQNHELKHPRRNTRIIHSGEWERKAKEKLAGFGIYPGGATVKVSDDTDSKITQAKSVVDGKGLKIADLRRHGGAFWIQAPHEEAFVTTRMNDIHKRLIGLGFKFMPQKGYWIK